MEWDVMNTGLINKKASYSFLMRQTIIRNKGLFNKYNEYLKTSPNFLFSLAERGGKKKEI